MNSGYSTTHKCYSGGAGSGSTLPHIYSRPVSKHLLRLIFSPSSPDTFPLRRRICCFSTSEPPSPIVFTAFQCSSKAPSCILLKRSSSFVPVGGSTVLLSFFFAGCSDSSYITVGAYIFPGAMADDLFVNLHMLAAAPISVCRRGVLQQAVETLGISMFESTSFNDDTDEILATIGLIIPDHMYMPRLKQWLFHGDWSLTSDAAIQSACFSTLAYLQKVNMLTIDGIHSSELKRCRRELLQASSWAEVFEDHAKKLQSMLSSLLDAKECTSGQPLVPLASTVLPEHAVDQDTVGPLPSHLVTKQEPPIYSLKHNSRKKVLVPTPLQVHERAETAFHRKKHRLIIGLQQSRADRAPRPSLPFEGSSSSENVSA